MIIDKTSRKKPLPGLPTANNPKRKTHAKMLINMTFLIPNRYKKKGIVRINSVFRNLRDRHQKSGMFNSK